MSQNFTSLDWAVVGTYLAALFWMGWLFRSYKPGNAREYFLGGNAMSPWVVAISVLATAQSAATFLGGPDQGFRGNYTYLTANIAAIIAAVFVTRILLPKFYAIKATTVYEILAIRYGARAMRAAGGMYLIGRVFASGSRLYLAAIAVAMILYSNIAPQSVITSSFILMTLGFMVTFFGGIRSVLWSDLIQFLIYFLTALAVLLFLWWQIPASGSEIIGALGNAPGDQNKLLLFDFSFNFSNPFTLISILTGLVLLNIASFGMDQDMTQRLLTCKSASDGGRALIVSALVAIPVVWVFISIGQLLHVFYERPDLMGIDMAENPAQMFNGEKITIFMHYILNQIPAGLKGLVVVGVIAAAISTINSGLNSMSSVIIQDFYRPWTEARSKRREEPGRPEQHFVVAGRVSMGLVGITLFAMSVLSYYWQKYTDMPLLEFALSVMVFSYSGLLGVYFTVLFTRRGSVNSVIWALISGFTTTVLLQDYVIDTLHLPAAWKGLAFTWHLCIGTSVAFLVCQLGNSPNRDSTPSETGPA